MTSLSPSQAADLVIRRRRARTSLTAYIEYAETGFAPAAHHRLLIAELERVDAGETERLLVCMPPGSAKSTYTSVLFPAWYLGRHPDRSILAASHTDELAEAFGRRVRNLYASPESAVLWGCTVSGDSQAAGRWATQRGGEYFAAGVGGAISGRRADLGIIDDPVKSREDADSQTRRNRIWDWYIDDFVPRLKPNAARILIQTRWHEDDLAGRILQREAPQWRVLSLPMVAMPGDPLGRTVGDRLWPEWFTPQMVDDARRDPRAWNALYQQEPAAEEGEYFRLAWFGTYDALPDHLHFYGASDYAVTEGAGDYTEHGIFGHDAQGNIYIADWWRGRAAADEWIERQCDLIQRHEPLCWFGESGPIRRAVEPFLLRRMGERGAPCRIEWLPSISDKPTRCRTFQALASMGKVLLPQHAPWKADLLGQLSRFPAGRFDDGVDVCSLIGRGLEVVKPPRIRRSRIEPARAIPLGGGPSSSWMGA